MYFKSSHRRRCFTQTGRHLVNEGRIIHFDQDAMQKNERHFFLFNDLFLLTKAEGRKVTRYKLKIKLDLKANINVETYTAAEFLGEAISNAFIVHTPRISFLFLCESSEARDILVDQFTANLSSRAS